MFAFFWDLSFCLPCPTLICKFYKKMLYYYSFVYFCLIRDRKGVDLDGRGWEGKHGTVEGGDTIIRIKYIRKKNLFFVRKEKD